MDQFYQAITEASHEVHRGRQSLLRGDTAAGQRHFENAGGALLGLVKGFPRHCRRGVEVMSLQCLYLAASFGKVASLLQTHVGTGGLESLHADASARGHKEFAPRVRQRLEALLSAGQDADALDCLREHVMLFPAAQAAQTRRDCCNRLGLGELAQEFQRDLDALAC